MTPDQLTRPAIAPARTALAPYAAFAAFGLFWGTWGAALPALRTLAEVTEGQLGTALLFVGLGALPSMALTGRAVDRFGLRVASLLLVVLAGAGLLVAATADGLTLLIAGMLLVGASSGAADVAVNTLAGRAEQATAKPLLTRSHGLFSIGVVIASLTAGALLGRGLSLLGVFAVAAAAMLALTAVSHVTSASLQLADPSPEEEHHDDARGQHRSLTDRLRSLRPTSPLVVIGLVAALAYAIENAHQSWGAVILTDVLNASPQVAAAGPATFAATAALARLTLAQLSRSHPTAVLIGGGALATAGCTVLAMAPSVAIALAGLVLAALGTATLFPTLLGRALRGTDPSQHGRATSAVATTAYLGFLLGPAYVGLLADTTNLRGAMIGIAVLAGIFTLAATPVSSWAARKTLDEG